LLLGLTLKGQSRSSTEEHLTELALLAETAGTEVIHIESQGREKIDSAYYIGKGKCEQLKGIAVEMDIDVIIFDDDLTPGQARNLEKLFKRRIIDRTGIILDIFARRAQTSEAKIQVELAQLNYLLPRLTRHWAHLSRQTGGGVYLRGPGETQLETDRRVVRERIATLKRKLQGIERSRATQRKKRSEMPVTALVGYTNAGKSTLLNAITQAEVFVEDKLFATLDPVVRCYEYDEGRKVLFTDTVGFIRKLPHHLVASFKSTLEEVISADLVIHVVDVAHPFYLEQMEQVRQIMQEIGAGDRPVMTVFNKVDLVRADSALALARNRFPEANFISALRRIGLEKMLKDIADRLFNPSLNGKIVIEPERAMEWNERFPQVKVIARKFVEDKVVIQFTTLPKYKDSLYEFAGTGNIFFDLEYKDA